MTGFQYIKMYQLQMPWTWYKWEYVVYKKTFLASLFSRIATTRCVGSTLISSFIPHRSQTESTAFLGALWDLSAQSLPKKAVYLHHIIMNGLPLKISFKISTNIAKQKQIRSADGIYIITIKQVIITECQWANYNSL